MLLPPKKQSHATPLLHKKHLKKAVDDSIGIAAMLPLIAVEPGPDFKAKRPFADSLPSLIHEVMGMILLLVDFFMFWPLVVCR